MYKIYIFMQCAPDPDQFFLSIFGQRADVQIGRISSDLTPSLSESEIEYRTGVVWATGFGWLSAQGPGMMTPSCVCASCSSAWAPALCQQKVPGSVAHTGSAAIGAILTLLRVGPPAVEK